MRALIVTIGIGLLTVIGSRESRACDRAPSAFEKPEVGVAVADLVITADVTARKGRVATVKIASTLRGTGAGPGDALEIGDLDDTGVVRMCGGYAVEVGKRYVFLLWSPPAGERAYRLLDPYAGVRPHSPDVEQTYASAIAKPHPHSASTTSGGLATQLVLAPDAATAGDVDLLVVMRNVGAKPITYRYSPWPRATQSRCELSIVHARTKQRVAARRVPIAERDIAAYFTKHAHAWEVTILPGAAHVQTLSRVTTAKPGWGYKEELGFVYYPIATPGEHAISATCRNLFGPGTRTSTATMRATL